MSFISTSTNLDSAPVTDRPVRHGAVTAVVCVALGAVTAAMSSLNVAIPDIARSTHATQTQLSWIIDAYSLVFAALLLPGGALGDRFGRRRMLLVGLSIFAIGSIAAMTASSAHTLIALRAVIGLGAALIMPATLSTITGTFPSAQRVKAVSIWAGVAGAAAVVGVLVSGTLLEFFSWRSVFAVNIVLAVAALVGTVRIVPESADPDAPRLDIAGACLSIAGLVVLVYSIIEAPTAGWISMPTLGGIALGLAVLVLFVVVELHRQRPMLDPRIFRRRRLSAGTLSIFVQFFGFYGFIFLILQYLQIVRRDSALIAAVSMLPMAVAMMPTSRLAPRLADRFSARRVCVAGLLLIAVAFVVIAQVGRETDYWVLAVGLLVLGAGMGAAMTPATSAITAALPRAQQGVASAMNDLAREVGGALGIAVLGSIVAATYRTHLDVGSLPAGEASRVLDSFAAAAHLGGPVADSADLAFVDGVHLALHVAAAVAVVAAVAVAVLLPRHDSPEISRA
ncbi:MFS transporter [Nocardioides sp.]|uniref:MFS transporter n=1 Tax=Nocardioides sp. TaxID=35761 RepID=UPI003D12EBE7